MTAPQMSARICQWCGNSHASVCPWVQAIEYDHRTGHIKRVEFYDRRVAPEAKA